MQETLSSTIRATGVDVNAVSTTTAKVAQTAQDGAARAQPFLSKAINFLTTTEPVTLAEYGLGVVALYYLGPPLLGAVFGSFRGFAGEISAAQALDSVNNDGNTLLIDIRTEVSNIAVVGGPTAVITTSYKV
eukprot:jgi/Chrzof1/7184/Cz02g14020.t1